jgi:hypothetical protein
VFEYDIPTLLPSGKVSTRKVDLYFASLRLHGTARITAKR